MIIRASALCSFARSKSNLFMCLSEYMSGFVSVLISHPAFLSPVQCERRTVLFNSSCCSSSSTVKSIVAYLNKLQLLSPSSSNSKCTSIASYSALSSITISRPSTSISPATNFLYSLNKSDIFISVSCGSSIINLKFSSKFLLSIRTDLLTISVRSVSNFTMYPLMS